MFPRTSAATALLAWPLHWIAPALATPPDPSSDPILNDPAITDVIVEKQRRSVGEEPRPPQAPPPKLESVPGVRAPSVDANGGAVDFSLADHRVYPEGTFIVGRVGAVVRARTGESIFVSAPPPPGSPDRRDAPMILLPCQRLSQLEASLEAPVPESGAHAAGTPLSRALTISGQVFVYADRMYLLPSAFAFPEPPRAPVQPATPGNVAPEKPSEELSADDLIRELERLPGSTRLLGDQPAAGAPDRATDSTALAARSQASVLPEGTVLTNRRGRLIRSAIEGELSFAFDNDPDSPGLPSMPLLPCKLLRTLESLASLQGDALQFRVSGRVTTYRGRNFLLPTWYQAVRQPGLRSRQ